MRYCKILLLAILPMCVMDASAADNRFFGLGIGPQIETKNTAVDSGGKSNSVQIYMDWNPHKYVGTRMFMGMFDGFWLGTALTVNGFLPDRRSNWYFVPEFSVPFLVNLKSNEKKIMTGPAVGVQFMFSVSSSRKYYFYVKPIDAYFPCFNWTTSRGFRRNFVVYLSASIGLKVRL